MKKALIAMSGGVDSSVAAYLMKKAGYDCIGVTMRLFCIGDASREKSRDPIEDARSVTRRLGIPHFVFDFADEFKAQVIDRFVSAYERGLTPNPCIYCNRYLKFDRLCQCARELGCDCIVTGHYARIEREGGRYCLKKAVDASKDQSYVLYLLTQQQLARTVFPLGGLSKAETRRIAEEQGFINANRRDSQDICFVPDGDYAGAIERYTGKTYPRGRFVDHEGNTLGEHRGIIRYTTGQRKGLGIAAPRPLYVCEKKAEQNEIVLGTNEDLFSTVLDAEDCNWIAFDTPPERLRVKAKIRYRQSEQWAYAFPTGESTVRVEFDAPQRAITAGQSVVLYDGDTVIGGGRITLTPENKL